VNLIVSPPQWVCLEIADRQPDCRAFRFLIVALHHKIAIRHNPVIAAFAKRLAGKKPKVVITVCMCKLLVILKATVRDKTKWWFSKTT
jgi:hypothetical protein